MSIIRDIITSLQKTDKKTVSHPDFKGKVEKAFKFKAKQYWRFKPENYGELDMPIGRYFHASVVYEELKHKLDFNDLEDWLNIILADASDGNLTAVIIKVNEIKKRLKLLFNPDIVFKLATVMIFDESEDLNSYDISYNKKKIEEFKEKGLGFFLSKPTSDYLNLKGISNLDLETYLREAEKIHQQGENIKELMKEKFSYTKD